MVILLQIRARESVHAIVGFRVSRFIFAITTGSGSAGLFHRVHGIIIGVDTLGASFRVGGRIFIEAGEVGAPVFSAAAVVAVVLHGAGTVVRVGAALLLLLMRAEVVVVATDAVAA